MKKLCFLMSALASMLFVGCSQDDFSPNGENEGNGESTTSYLAVNLASADTSRAAAGYEDGSSDENQINNVRFYFFTANGVAANVKIKDGSYVNYYDWANPGQSVDKNDGDDIEKKLDITLVIETAKGDKVPQMIAAVLNPDPDVLNDDAKNLSDLKTIVNDYSKSSLTTEGKFVMFNSVYANQAKTAEICAVPITAENLATKKEDAEAHPVTIFVERCVAKVKATMSVAKDEKGKIKLTDTEGKDLVIDGKQVYLKINGWNLTADTDNALLVKKIDLGWTTSWWNGTHRSFWATNSPSAKNRYHSYDEIGSTLPDARYTNENAQFVDGTGLASNKTKVIIKATLCDENGDALTLVRHLGVHFVDNPATLELLKNSILAQLSANNCNYYYAAVEMVGDKETPVRKQIGPDDLEIVAVEQIEKENSQNNCFVCAQLTTAAQAKTWYTSLDETATALENAATVINGNLANSEIVDRALVWNSGMTYYYYEIIHNGTGETATKGIVRNHIYDTKVTKIAGLGTPVYDPTKDIYPEKPKSNDHFIAAEINILSWRVVTNEYELKW